MRLLFFSAVVSLPSLAVAQSAVDAQSDKAEAYQLGGAASRTARVATAPVVTLNADRPTLSLPVDLTLEDPNRAERAFGPATIFLTEGTDEGREALELGTSLSRGQATAGLSLTYLDDEDEVTRSEVFLDYALTERFSVGVSGVFDPEQNPTEPLRQLGVNAEYSTSGGTFIQGGFASAPDYDPLIGLSVGLRF
ncbi:MAG: hypothetical protein ACU0GG_03350 [Paracoccaceae bacterium]